MSAWARQRQFIITTYIVLGLILVSVVGYFVFVYQPPSCQDNVRNGTEEGIDCGGGCQLVCPFAASSPNVVWARAFEIGPGLYNLSAEIENPNFKVGAEVEYVFRSYNDKNILINETFGTIPLHPTEKRIIFEPSVETGQRRISRVFLEFTGESDWYQLQPLVKYLVTRGYTLEDVDTVPKLRAKIYNTDVRPVDDITVIAVLYDDNDNVYQVSQTYIDRIKADSEGQAFFTWRAPFDSTIQKVEVFIIEPQQ